jgi:hypothetical protein
MLLLQVDSSFMAGLSGADPSSLQAIGLLGGLNLMQPNAAAAAAAAAAATMLPTPDAAVAEAAAAAAAAGSAAAAAAAASEVPRSRAALRQQLQQEYERAGLTRRLTSLDYQVRWSKSVKEMTSFGHHFLPVFA